MHGSHVALLLGALLASGCAAPPDGTTSSGTWRVSLGGGAVLVGWNDLELDVVRVEDELPADGVALTVEATMPSMGHGSSEDVAVQALGAGAFEVTAFFQMDGLWELSGEVAGPSTESWVLDVEVLSE